MNRCLAEGLSVVDCVCAFVSGEQDDGGCLSLAPAMNCAPF